MYGRTKGGEDMFPNLRAEMARKNITHKKISETLNISIESIGNKMNGRTEFTRIEMFTIKQMLFPDLSIDYLFKIEEQAI